MNNLTAPPYKHYSIHLPGSPALADIAPEDVE